MKTKEEDYQLLKVKNPKGKQSKRVDTMAELDNLLKDLSKVLKMPKFDKKQRKKKVHFSGRLSNNYSQRCVVKMSYGNSLEGHDTFFRSYMTQEEKEEISEKPKYFDAVYDEVPDDEIAKYEAEMTEMYFKFILSPESKTVPLKVLAREFIKNLQLQTGFGFTWKAVIHTNTDHPHCHVLLNGRDRKTGKLIKRIPPRIIRNARLSAEQICTQLVGPVTSAELEVRNEKTITAKRWTKYDDVIILASTPIDYKAESGAEYSMSISPSDLACEKRLKALVEIGLAICFTKNNPPKYYLEKDWDKKLRSIGRYNSFLEARSNLLFSTPGTLEQYTPAAGRIKGVVAKVYIMDDESVWTNALVVENEKTKKAYYIPLKNPPNQNLLGKIVTVECGRNQSGKLSPRIKVLGGDSLKSVNKSMSMSKSI